MQFDIRKFLESGKNPFSTSFSVDFSASNFDGYKVIKPVGCQFEAQNTLDGVFFTLSVDAEIEAECARCLAPITQSYKFTREYIVKERDLDDPDFELPVNEKGSLNLEELAFQELIFEVPRVLLCSTDCLGLCPICGKRKAAGCSCQQADEDAPADARLSILKQLLS